MTRNESFVLVSHEWEHEMKQTIAVVLILTASQVAVADDAESKDDAHAQAAQKYAAKLTAELMKGFAAADTDGDDQLDLMKTVKTLQSLGYGAEPAAPAAPARGRGRGGAGTPEDRFKANDKNGDGKLTGDEINALLKDHPESDDDVVTLEEFQHIWQEMFGGSGNRGRGGARGGQGGGGGEAALGRGGRGQGGASRSRGRGGRGSGSGGGRYGGLRSSDVEFLAAIDENRDGKVTPDELHAAIKRDMSESARSRSELDTDGNGEISTHEYSLSMPPRDNSPRGEDGLDGHGRGHFNREDLNRDGVISADEIVERVALQAEPRIRAIVLSLRLASRADTDGNSAVSSDELAGALNDAWLKVLRIEANADVDPKSIYPRLRGASSEETSSLLQEN